MASFVYDSFLADVFAGNCSTSHSYKGMLVNNTYTPTRTHSKRSSITGEVSGTNYTAGGEPVTLSFSVNPTTKLATLTISAVSWPSSTIGSARSLIVYRARGGSAAADELVCCDEALEDLSSNGTTLSVAQSTWAIPLPAPI